MTNGAPSSGRIRGWRLACRRDTLRHPTFHPRPPWSCLDGHQCYGLLRLLTRLPSGLHFFSLCQQSRRMWVTDEMRPPLFHRPLPQHPAHPTPKSPSRLLSRFLTASLAFAVVEQLGSLWCRASRLTFRHCRIQVTLRAAALPPSLREMLSFGTTGL